MEFFSNASVLPSDFFAQAMILHLLSRPTKPRSLASLLEKHLNKVIRQNAKVLIKLDDDQSYPSFTCTQDALRDMENIFKNMLIAVDPEIPAPSGVVKYTYFESENEKLQAVTVLKSLCEFLKTLRRSIESKGSNGEWKYSKFNKRIAKSLPQEEDHLLIRLLTNERRPKGSISLQAIFEIATDAPKEPTLSLHRPILLLQFMGFFKVDLLRISDEDKCKKKEARSNSDETQAQSQAGKQ